MIASEAIAAERVADLRDAPAIGVDIGSRQAKAVLVGGGEIHTAITASGVDTQETADRLVRKLLRSADLPRNDIAAIVGTGYGRIALAYDDVRTEVVTEISCHAMGAHYLNAGTRTIIDIGGQDSKAIKVDPENGRVREFVMNDKCAAGTGRFLEKIAELLGYQLEELGDRALESTNRVDISSQCVVFAESEVISLKARGIPREDIAAGIHFASARRVRNLVNRIGLEPELVFSGGVSSNKGMKQALEELIGHPISSTRLDTVYAGALGAAVIAQQISRGAAL
ncbi:putative ATPase, activator of (R)-hydroxyglutaryl-CoA dehdratase [Rhodovastum atsumiense]|uniref:CoA activase n=1 Tax=Rhodovastum atsumiense TaxID=504468 RepID=A0A5M6IUI7_9PROT|nr:acyl-CoA dehydratase activase [Rhodovastum atsumiense]KAA5611970.1 CoA activase [Rhodovastum atsumiense]CAH2598749.1 putative ATPase, activator of (R)-hydroxyglutaryl-CoA dehdratase [Rhodovastum atsumiense]